MTFRGVAARSGALACACSVALASGVASAAARGGWLGPMAGYREPSSAGPARSDRSHPRATIHRPRATIHRPRATIHRPRATIRHPRAATPPAPSARVVLTTAGLAYALTPMPSLRFGGPSARGVPVIHVSDTARYQRVTGFGAAMTDSSAWLLSTQLSPAIRRLAMNALFAPRGIHLDFVRVPIGASDFTVGQPYSYDDVPAGQADPALSQFSIAHDQAYIIPALRQMLAINPGVEILATPWTAPPWMKSNGAFDNLHGLGTLPPSSFGAFAAYIVRFIQAYAAQGIPISAITPENEPGAGVPYPGMSLAASDAATFIAQYLAPALGAAGLHPKIYGVDRGASLPDAQALLSSPARPSLGGIAWHCYGGFGTLAAFGQAAPGVDQIVSECSPGIIPYSPAEVGIGATRAGASAVALWNLALDPQGGPVQQPNTGCPGCSGVITVSEQTHAVTLGAGFYQFGQLSKFVAPGAIRIGSERFVSDFRLANGLYGVTPGLDDVAFLNPDGTKVLVAYNGSARGSRFAVAWHGRSFTYTLQQGATVTFLWR